MRETGPPLCFVQHPIARSLALAWRPRHRRSRYISPRACRSRRLTAPVRARSSTTSQHGSNGARPENPPPHNLQAERSLLGAALLSPTACATAATVPVGAFYGDNHADIAAAIIGLHLDGKPVDPVTVADRLGPELLDKIGGGRALVGLQEATPSTGNAGYYAELVLEDWQLRRTINSGTELAHAAWNNDLDGVARWRAEIADIHTVAFSSSWDEIDLEAVVTGDLPPLVPTILRRDDGIALIYPGKVHAFNAESESGKSWLAMAACAEQIRDGQHVVYIDFEDGAEGVTERLEMLGVHPGLLYGPDRLFHYVRPDDPIDPTAITRLARLDAVLVVIDGVTEAMTQNGWSIKENDDVALFLAQLPRIFARSGAAVILIDHVVKNKADRGDDAIGGQHKRAGIDGASFKLEMVRPFGRNMAGAARLTVTKDRHGHIRPHCVAGKTAGELRLTSSDDRVRAVVVAPSTMVDPDSAFRPTVLMERISRYIETENAAALKPSLNELLKSVKGDRTAKQTAVRILVDEGFVVTEPGKQNSKRHASVRPYRENDDMPASTEGEPYEPF